MRSPPRAYYSEFNPYVAAWLKKLIFARRIPAGDVDTRDIRDVQPGDLDGYGQCHFFAGIAGWPLALALAGWPADRPVWTGSCPCQPLSAAGVGLGADDERHCWPDFHRLIAHRRPPIVFGEQVASALGRTWLAAVRADLEALDYAVGSADLCAAGIGAPHIRQRVWFVAEGVDHANSGERQRRQQGAEGRDIAELGRGFSIVADAAGESGRLDPRPPRPAPTPGDAGGLADAEHGGREGGNRLGKGQVQLCHSVLLAGWPTPMAGTPAQHGYNEAGNSDSARKTVALVAGGPARLTAHGLLLTGSSAAMASGGQLNPGHSRWLMGFPIVWERSAPMVTRSSRL